MNGLALISGVGLIMQCKHSVDMPDDIYIKNTIIRRIIVMTVFSEC